LRAADRARRPADRPRRSARRPEDPHVARGVAAGRARGAAARGAGGRQGDRRAGAVRRRRHRRVPPRRPGVRGGGELTVDGVVFDMDGVLIQSEHVWDDIRERLTVDSGGRWRPGAQEAMMGLSSTEWSRYMHDELQVPLPPEEINRQVVERLSGAYRRELPAIDGASEAVRRLAADFTLAVASSSNRPLIDLVLELLGVQDCFAATVSSEEVAHGKPAPDVYLEAARLLHIAPARLVA